MRLCSVCRRCYSDDETYCVDIQHPQLLENPGRGLEMVPGYRVEYADATVGTVERYLAKQVESNRDCVITVLSLNSPDQKEFLADAKAAGSIFHPNIVDFFESGVLDSGDPYSVSELPGERTLRDLLNTDGVPPLLTSIRVIGQTAEAVHALHLNGLVHGAVRPENILVLSGSSKVSVRLQNPDLGGAIGASVVSNKFALDSAIGSIRYFAPEQFSKVRPVPQTDVYALGSVLFEMLCGIPPFDGSTASEVIEKIKNEHPPDIRIDNFDLRMLITHTLMESLQKQPGLRQSTALAFARQMRHVEQLATHSPTPPAAFPAAIPQQRIVVERSPSRAVIQPAIATAKVAVPAANVAIPAANNEQISTAQVTRSTPLAQQPVQSIPVVARDATPQLEQVPTELNRSRLRQWREKFGSLTQGFSSDRKSPMAELSIAPSELRKDHEVPPQAKSTEAASTFTPADRTRIKVDWDQPEDDLPTIEQVRKAQVEETISAGPTVANEVKERESSNAQITLPSRKPRRETELFAFYEKPSRRSAPTPDRQSVGLFSAYGPSVSRSSMNRRFIAGGFAAAVVVGLLFGSSLLDRERVRSANSETKIEAQPAPNQPVIADQEIPVEEESAAVPQYVPPATSHQSAKYVEEKSPTVNIPNKGTTLAKSPKAPSTKPETQTVRRNVANVGPRSNVTPSTLVIYPSNGKVKSKVEPGSALTRPRIVANPKP